ncbi:MAG TPA: hypothetical protein VF008_20400 [Niastella sp.]
MKDSNNSDKVSCSSLGEGAKNLFDKKRKKHIVQSVYDGPFVLDIIRQIIQAVTCNIPTHNQQLPIKDKLSRLQLQSLFEKNAPVYSYQNNMAVPVVA